MANTRFALPGSSAAIPCTRLHAVPGLRYLAAYTPESITAATLASGTPRSAEYRAGLLDVLKFKMHGVPIHCPHRAGSVQFDAYFSGNRHGFDVYRAHLEMQGGRHD